MIYYSQEYVDNEILRYYAKMIRSSADTQEHRYISLYYAASNQPLPCVCASNTCASFTGCMHVVASLLAVSSSTRDTPAPLANVKNVKT